MLEKKFSSLRCMTLAGIMVALSIVLTRFLSIQFPVFRLGIGMAPVHLAGYLLGPVWGGLSGLAADTIGLMINPIGTPNIGITLTTTLHGIIAGLVMRAFGRRMSPTAVIVSGLLTSVLCSWLLMSFFLSRMYGDGFQVLLVTRSLGVFVQGTVLMIVESLMIPIFSRIRRFLPADLKFAGKPEAETSKYDKISEKSYRTRR